MRLFLSIVLFSTFFSLGFAQSAGKIKGNVQVDTGEPAEFAMVILLEGDDMITGAMTDEWGNYSLPDVDPGSYTLQFRWNEHKTEVEQVVVLPREIITIDAKFKIPAPCACGIRIPPRRHTLLGPNQFTFTRREHIRQIQR